jgi:hypothetical protein
MCFFLNSIVTTSTYGATLAKGQLTILDKNGYSAFPLGSAMFQGMNLPLGYSVNLAETDGVVKPTEPTLAQDTEYGFILQQFNPFLNSFVTHYVYASTTTTTTAGTIANLWATQISFFKDLNVTTSVSGAVLTITAASGYPVLLASGGYNGVTFTSGTTPVVGIGNVNDLTAYNDIVGQPFSNYTDSNGTGYSAAIAATGYDRVVFNYQTIDGSQYQTILFVNISDTNYSNFKTSLVTDILKVGGLSYAEQAVAVN